MDRSRALKQWTIIIVGIMLMILAARGRFGSGLASLLTPQNMAETSKG